MEKYEIFYIHTLEANIYTQKIKQMTVFIL